MQRTTKNSPCETCGRGASMPEIDIDQPITHCEWCGAEYPAPEPANGTNPTTADEVTAAIVGPDEPGQPPRRAASPLTARRG